MILYLTIKDSLEPHALWWEWNTFKTWDLSWVGIRLPCLSITAYRSSEPCTWHDYSWSSIRLVVDGVDHHLRSRIRSHIDSGYIAKNQKHRKRENNNHSWHRCNAQSRMVIWQFKVAQLKALNMWGNLIEVRGVKTLISAIPRNASEGVKLFF